MIEDHSQLLMQIQSYSRALATAAGARPLRSLRRLLRCWFGLIAPRETHSHKISVIDTTGLRGRRRAPLEVARLTRLTVRPEGANYQ